MKIGVRIILLSLIFSYACGSSVSSLLGNAYISESNGKIPSDFGKENTTTLFVTYNKEYNLNMTKLVENDFKGKYEFISYENYMSALDLYKASKKYKYAFLIKQKTQKNYKNYGKLETYTTSQLTGFYIENIRTDYKYSFNISSNKYKPFIKVFLKKLNKKWTSFNK